ncbi:hypothetical protein AN958_03396, partial [Leucoagaricus sp. SymC.cos]
VPPELDQTLSTLTSHRSVLGYLLIARGGPSSASIIRHSGVVFEGEKGRKYAGVIAKIVESVQAGLEEVNGSSVDDSSETVCCCSLEIMDCLTLISFVKDEVRFMRIRTKRHEIMISPDERYLLAVLHDPTVA